MGIVPVCLELTLDCLHIQCGKLKFKRGSNNNIIIVFGVIWFILRCTSDEEGNWLVISLFLPLFIHSFVNAYWAPVLQVPTLQRIWVSFSLLKHDTNSGSSICWVCTWNISHVSLHSCLHKAFVISQLNYWSFHLWSSMSSLLYVVYGVILLSNKVCH